MTDNAPSSDPLDDLPEPLERSDLEYAAGFLKRALGHCAWALEPDPVPGRTDRVRSGAHLAAISDFSGEVDLLDESISLRHIEGTGSHPEALEDLRDLILCAVLAKRPEDARRGWRWLEAEAQELTQTRNELISAVEAAIARGGGDSEDARTAQSVYAGWLLNTGRMRMAAAAFDTHADMEAAALGSGHPNALAARWHAMYPRRLWDDPSTTIAGFSALRTEVVRALGPEDPLAKQIADQISQLQS